MPLVSKAFGDIITFERATAGSYFDATGTLQSAAINAPRFDYNPSTLAAQGLLIEEQRANLLTYSEQFDNVNWTKTDATVTANSVTSPDGTVNADKLVEGTLSTGHFVQQLVSITTATAYTGSIYVKAGERTTVDILAYRGATFGGLSVNLSTGAKATPQTAGVSDLSATSTVKAVANGYFIVSVPFTSDGVSGGLRVTLSNGSTTAYTGNGTSGLYIWGAQLEAGAFPTSYIPTTTAAVTRSADVASVNTLSPWYNSVESTIVMSGIGLSASTYRPILQLDDGTANNRLYVDSNSGPIRAVSTVSGSNQCLISLGSMTANNLFKVACAYKLNDCAASLNAGAVGTDATATMPTVDRLRIGSDANSYWNGWIQRITYYPRRLTNAELQAITA